MHRRRQFQASQTFFEAKDFDATSRVNLVYRVESLSARLSV